MNASRLTYLVYVPSPGRSCSYALAAFGVAAASLGPILPGVRHDLGVGDIGTGLAISAAGAGWGSGVLTSSRVSCIRGRRTSFLWGTILLTIGLTLLAVAPVGAVVIASAFLFSFGGGLLTGAVNSALAEADDGSLATANGFFGVGAIAGPLMASALVGVGPGWRRGTCGGSGAVRGRDPAGPRAAAGQAAGQHGEPRLPRPAPASPVRAARGGDRARRRQRGRLHRLDRDLRRRGARPGRTGSRPPRRWRSGRVSRSSGSSSPGAAWRRGCSSR